MATKSLKLCHSALAQTPDSSIYKYVSRYGCSDLCNQRRFHTVRYHEFDFKEVASAKAKVIVETPALRQLVHENPDEVSIGISLLVTFSNDSRPGVGRNSVANILPAFQRYSNIVLGVYFTSVSRSQFSYHLPVRMLSYIYGPRKGNQPTKLDIKHFQIPWCRNNSIRTHRRTRCLWENDDQEPGCKMVYY
jgi:hypothetical protein